MTVIMLPTLALLLAIPETDEEDEGKDAEEDNQETDVNLSQLQPVITHSIVFKCIGCTRENRYQEALCRVLVWFC